MLDMAIRLDGNVMAVNVMEGDAVCITTYYAGVHKSCGDVMCKTKQLRSHLFGKLHTCIWNDGNKVTFIQLIKRL